MTNFSCDIPWSDLRQSTLGHCARGELGVLPLPLGEMVGVRGFEAHRETLTPHPTPLPSKSGLPELRTFEDATRASPGRVGEGADRASLQSVTLSEESDLSKLR